jgi:hypothetical protein
MKPGDIYERMTRLPARGKTRPAKPRQISIRRRRINAFVVPLAAVLAGRGAIEILNSGGSTLVATGAVAAALTAWLVARWHLSSAGRGRTAATVLGVALIVCIGSAMAIRWTGIASDPISRLGLLRGLTASLIITALVSVAVAMMGMKRPADAAANDS